MYISSPLFIPKAQRLSVMEYICRVNYYLPLGHFELNMEKCSVRYRLTLALEEGPLSSSMLSSMILSGGMSFRQYFPGLVEIIRVNRNPAEVLLDTVREPSLNLHKERTPLK